MKLKHFILTFCALLFFTTLKAQEAPKSADAILQEAYKQAAKEKRKYLLFFMHPGAAGAIKWTKQ